MKTKTTARYSSIRLAEIKIIATTTTTTIAGEDAVKLDHANIDIGNIKWYTPSRKQFGNFIYN